MQAFCKNIRWFGSVAMNPKFSIYGKGTSVNFLQQTSGNSKFHGFGTQRESLTSCDGIRSFLSLYNCLGLGNSQIGMADLRFPIRFMTTMDKNEKSTVNCDSAIIPGVVPRIKFKRPDKTAGHIMQILDKEAVGQVRAVREIADVQPGCILQLKVEVPENKRRVSLIKGIVIAKRNAGLNTTFRLRRMVAGVGVESVYPLYSPNIKEIKVLERKKVRRAKLYYLRDKMNALKGSKA